MPSMVVFVDLEEEPEPLHVIEARRLAAAAAALTDKLESRSLDFRRDLVKPPMATVVVPIAAPVLKPEPELELTPTLTPTFQSPATEAFGCYP